MKKWLSIMMLSFMLLTMAPYGAFAATDPYPDNPAAAGTQYLYLTTPSDGIQCWIITSSTVPFDTWTYSYDTVNGVGNLKPSNGASFGYEKWAYSGGTWSDLGGTSPSYFSNTGPVKVDLTWKTPQGLFDKNGSLSTPPPSPPPIPALDSDGFHVRPETNHKYYAYVYREDGTQDGQEWYYGWMIFKVVRFTFLQNRK